jgi:hypothetical protein
MDQIIPGWKQVATLHEGQTAKHTLLVFASCLNLPEYGTAEDQTRRELEWAAVLHDFDKKLAGRDAAHPFRSAAIVAQILPDLGFDSRLKNQSCDLEAWSKLVLSAQRQDREVLVHDHSALKKIIDGLHQCWGLNSSASRVLKSVLLHQSLPTIQDWINPVLLTDEELSYALTLKDMGVLGPLLIADSDSWNIFSENRFAYLVELRINIAETRHRIQNNHDHRNHE